MVSFDYNRVNTALRKKQKMIEITSETTISRSQDQVSKKLEAATIIMHIEEGKYYNLNRVASRIWEIIDQPKTISQLMDQLLSEFEITQEDCERDLKELVANLTDLGLIQVN